MNTVLLGWFIHYCFREMPCLLLGVYLVLRNWYEDAVHISLKI